MGERGESKGKLSGWGMDVWWKNPNVQEWGLLGEYAAAMTDDDGSVSNTWIAGSNYLYATHQSILTM